MYKSLSARIKATQGIETPPELDKDNQLKSLNIVRLVYASLTEGEQKKVDLLFTLTVGVDLGKMIQE